MTFEVERQICEAPDVCIIVQWDEQADRAQIVRFETESGEVIAYPGQDEFRAICNEHFDEIAAVLTECSRQAKEALGFS